MGAMSRPAESALRFRTLHASPIVRVREYVCCAARGRPGAEEGTHATEIVFLRHGAFCRHFGSQSVTTDVNRVAFFARGTSWRTSHPADCGDRGTLLELAPDVLAELRRDFEPASADDPGRALPFHDGACDAKLAWRHHAFARRLARARTEPCDSLAVESEALELGRRALELAYAGSGVTPKHSPRGSSRAHAELADAVQALLAARASEPLQLRDLADAVGASPFHLARVFRDATGVPIHRYRTRLRLRLALERIAEGAGDLAELALELGFASHSHFTDAFRREFGRPPSAARVPDA